MGRNKSGLRRFGFHRDEGGGSEAIAASLAPPRPRRRVGVAAVGATSPAALDPEAAARAYLQNALRSDDLPELAAAEVAGSAAEFKSIGHRSVPLTGTQTVKFRQLYRKIPIYGSLVTVEMDAENRLLSINSALGEPAGVDPVASLSPAEALARVRDAAGYGEQTLDAMPRLFYWFDARADRWRLVYITENVFRLADGGGDDHRLPQLFDYVVDAHSGELVAELPRTQTVDPLASGAVLEDSLEPRGDAGDAGDIEALDGLGIPRRIRFVDDPQRGRHLADPRLNVHTYDFGLRSLVDEKDLLPGEYVCQRDSDPWDPAAVSAHANAAAVAEFLAEVLLREGLDGEGGRYVSSIRCVRTPGTDEWRNAAWIGKQMVYGQRRVGEAVRSYAVALDVVAHEIFHGVNDSTARLEYSGETGALNESYSDVFGVLIANRAEPDVARWNWQIGEELDGTGLPLRDLSDPQRCGQPDHMDDYRELPETEEGDWGGVHVNSGIHNQAAYLLLTGRDEAGAYRFEPDTVAKLFYLTLTEQLSRTSGFADSRRGLELVARSLFRFDPDRNAKLAAIAQAFDAVGIEA